MQPPLSRKEERRECTMDSARIPEKIDEVPFKAIVRKLLQAHCDSKLMRSWTRERGYVYTYAYTHMNTIHVDNEGTSGIMRTTIGRLVGKSATEKADEQEVCRH